MTPVPLLTLDEAAAYVKVSRRTIQRATDLPRIRIGRAVRFRQSDLDTWLKDNTTWENACGSAGRTGAGKGFV